MTLVENIFHPSSDPEWLQKLATYIDHQQQSSFPGDIWGPPEPSCDAAATEQFLSERWENAVQAAPSLTYAQALMGRTQQQEHTTSSESEEYPTLQQAASLQSKQQRRPRQQAAKRKKTQQQQQRTRKLQSDAADFALLDQAIRESRGAESSDSTPPPPPPPQSFYDQHPELLIPVLLVGDTLIYVYGRNRLQHDILHSRLAELAALEGNAAAALEAAVERRAMGHSDNQGFWVEVHKALALDGRHFQSLKRALLRGDVRFARESPLENALQPKYIKTTP